MQLDVTQINRLLAEGLALGLAGTHARVHERGAAIEGGALATRGRVGRQHRRAPQAPAATGVTAPQAVRRADQSRERHPLRLAAH
jgi:hypothetical protein